MNILLTNDLDGSITVNDIHDLSHGDGLFEFVCESGGHIKTLQELIAGGMERHQKIPILVQYVYSRIGI